MLELEPGPEVTDDDSALEAYLARFQQRIVDEIYARTFYDYEVALKVAAAPEADKPAGREWGRGGDAPRPAAAESPRGPDGGGPSPGSGGAPRPAAAEPPRTSPDGSGPTPSSGDAISVRLIPRHTSSGPEVTVSHIFLGGWPIRHSIIQVSQHGATSLRT